MANNEVDYSTIRIKNDLRKELDSLKIEAESYSVVISKLIEDNKRLEELIEYLKEDRKELYKVALGSSDSVALVNNIHKATYIIASVVNDISTDKEQKLQQLEIYLTEMLENNPEDVKATVENLKEMFKLEELDVPEVLIDFENYLRENY